MGVIQRAMVRSCPHIWFERSEMKDRHLVTQRYYGPWFHVIEFYLEIDDIRFRWIWCVRNHSYKDSHLYSVVPYTDKHEKDLTKTLA